jgi:hypothetical protein
MHGSSNAIDEQKTVLFRLPHGPDVEAELRYHITVSMTTTQIARTNYFRRFRR